MAKRSLRRSKHSQKDAERNLIFGPHNYQLLFIAVLLLFTGFGGMYIEMEFKGWFSLYVSPLLIVAGFITVAVAILRKDPSETPKTESSETSAKT